MGISAEKLKLQKRAKREKNMEILGLKGSITRMKKSLNGLSRLEIAEERVHEFDRTLAITNFRNKERKGLKKNEHNIRNLWDNIRWSNIHVIGAPEEDCENKAEKKFEEIIVKILLSLRKTLFTRSKKLIKLPKQ